MQLSIIIPTYNEILYISRSFESIILAGSEIESEFFFVDGQSNDGTYEWIKKQIKKIDNCRLILNDKKFVSHGFNIVFNDTKGEFISRVDGHTIYPKSYFSDAYLDLANGEDQKMYRDWCLYNMKLLFKNFEESLPTTIDVLTPNSPLLDTLYHLRPACWVTIHNVIGVAHHTLRGERTDCVVSETSARHPGAISELDVKATHTGVHHKLMTVAEIERILRLHLVESGLRTASN